MVFEKTTLASKINISSVFWRLACSNISGTRGFVHVRNLRNPGYYII